MTDLKLDGFDRALVVRRSQRARRLRLRVRPVEPHFELVLPQRMPMAEARRFAERNLGWLTAQAARLPSRRPFVHGGTVPLRGQLLLVTATGHRQGSVSVDGDRLLVGGEAAHLPRRVRDFLIREARRDLTAAVAGKAARIGRKPPPITLRDPSSRWGSCAASGRLSFSWRLVMAPAAVLDYVAAHEVAHLRHLDHSAAFWSLCRSLTDDAAFGEAWLRRHGTALHAVG